MEPEEIKQKNPILIRSSEETSADNPKCSSFEDLEEDIDTCKSFIIKEVNLLSNTTNIDVLLMIFEKNQIEYSCATSEFRELKKKIEESTIVPETCPTNMISLCDPYMVFSLILGISFQLLLVYFFYKSSLIGDNSAALLSILIFLLSSSIDLWFVLMLNQSKKRVEEAWELRKAELGSNNVSRSSLTPVNLNKTISFLQSLNNLDRNIQMKKVVFKMSQFTHNTEVILIIKNNTSVFTCATPSLEPFLKNLKIHGGSNNFKDFFKLKECYFPFKSNQREVAENTHSNGHFVLNFLYSSLLVLFYLLSRKLSQS